MFILRESLRMGEREYGRVRQIALAFPGVSERVSHGARCFFIQDRRPLCYFHDNHRGDGRISLWCPAPPGVPDLLVGAQPERFFKPPTSASGAFAGWLGTFLHRSAGAALACTQIADILQTASPIAHPHIL